MRGTLVESLRDSVENHGDKPAVVLRGQSVSYRQLWRQAESMAGFYAAHGVSSGERVAILLQNSPDYVACYYGAWLAGGVAVALNIQASATDVLNWLRHCDAKILVMDNANVQIAEILAGITDRVVLILNQSDKPILALESNSRVYTAQDVASITSRAIYKPPQLERPAAIIYTSGTTGAPKGVTLSHANLAANTASILEYLKLSSRDSIVNVLPFFYSYGNSVLHTHLAVGGTLYLENSLAYPHLVMESMAQNKVTGFSGVPSTFALLLSRVDLTKYDLSSLRYMTQAGGPMTVAHIERLRAAIPGIHLFVMYGQTEATARLAFLPPEKLDEKLGSAGMAIPGVELEIRDDDGNTVPRGEKGEIYARGANIMLGYWGDAAATGQVMRDGWLKTGDLAYMDTDGYIFIHGRGSEIIKSGAFRISPLEIEEVVLELTEIAEAAAVGVPDDILGEIIKLVIVPKSGFNLDARNVQAYCRKRLPLYKVPKIVEFAESLPRTTSGKIRRALLANKQKEGL